MKKSRDGLFQHPVRNNGLLIDRPGAESRRVKLDIYIDYRDSRPADLAVIFTNGYDLGGEVGVPTPINFALTATIKTWEERHVH